MTVDGGQVCAWPVEPTPDLDQLAGADLPSNILLIQTGEEQLMG